ncbi:MAG: serine/threonine protein kinase [Pirellulales bacterium]|nr:serine/threonine protein kinase [Pirellulales bacterium]
MSDATDKPTKTTPRVDLSGRHFGDFRLLRRLGRGAMADVYLAEQSGLRRRVAVKILRPELANDQTYLKRFEIEAQAAASLVHANIVQIYEVGYLEGLRFIVQEYVQGQNLQDWVTRHGPPDLPHALSIMRQGAAALAKAAEQGVVHRDIKPENILLTQTGEVKVADFGLARVAREGEAVDLTQVGVTLGTPLYMSPEQVEGKPLDPRSDIYSFGVTCYQMLAGTPPFSSETALGVAVQHLNRQPEVLENLRPDLPPALCRIVHKMLAKPPEKRFQSARDLLRELRRLHLEHFGDDWPEELPGWETTGVELPADSRAATTQHLGALMKTMALQRPSRRTRWALWGGAAGSFLLGGVFAWFAAAEPSLLAGAKAPPPKIPRQESALQQYLDASRIGTEEAWQCVLDYFPDKQYFTRRAKQQLARIHLREGDYDQALILFNGFADPGEPDVGLRAFGLAGKCGVLTLLGKYGESALVLDELWPIRSELRDEQMRKLLDSVVKTNQSNLGAHSTRQWDEWLAEKFPEDG